MSYTVQKLIEIAAAEIGYLEKKSNKDLDDKIANVGSNNYTKYARDLNNAGYYNGNKNGFAWCDVFVDWCHYKAANDDAAEAQRVICQSGPYGAGCYWSMEYYKKVGRLFEKPIPGDQIFFCNSSGGISHTGIVYKVDTNKVYTIEGNTSSAAGVVANGGCVAKKSYSLTYKRIVGYGRPKYLDGSSAINYDFSFVDSIINADTSKSEYEADNAALVAAVQSATKHNFFTIIITEVSATAITVQVKANIATSKPWQIQVIDLIKNKESYSKNKESESLGSISISGLAPATPYVLKVTGINNDLQSSQQVFFTTTADILNDISDLKVTFNKESIFEDPFKVSFTAPTTFGSVNNYTDKGYRVSLVINNQLVCYSDTLIKYTTGKMVTKKLSLADFLKLDKTLSIAAGDIVQVGIQTWARDTTDRLIFSSISPVCSQPYYVKSDMTSVDKIYIKNKNIFKRAILWHST